jgi:hypothetical protein
LGVHARQWRVVCAEQQHDECWRHVERRRDGRLLGILLAVVVGVVLFATQMIQQSATALEMLINDTGAPLCSRP